MALNFVKMPGRLKPHWVLVCLTIFIFSGCAAQPISHTSFDRALLKDENIQKVTVVEFESPFDDLQAGSHISKLFEMNLLQTGLYRIAERGETEKFLKERGMATAPVADRTTIRQMGERLQVDGIIFGSVSQYSRFNLAFTARLVSVRSGLILWSISQTGGRVFNPLSQVADEMVRMSVDELQSKIR
jgi:hypothetical protein